jgi:hypothetical protein
MNLSVAGSAGTTASAPSVSHATDKTIGNANFRARFVKVFIFGPFSRPEGPFPLDAQFRPQNNHTKDFSNCSIVRRRKKRISKGRSEYEYSESTEIKCLQSDLFRRIGSKDIPAGVIVPMVKSRIY